MEESVAQKYSQVTGPFWALVSSIRARLGNSSVAIPITLVVIALSWKLFFRKRSNSSVFSVFLVKPGEKRKLPISEIEDVSHDTKRFRLKLPAPDMKLGLPTGKHISIVCPNPPKCLQTGLWNGKEDPDGGKKEIERKYTPVTNDETTVGFMDLVIKVYRPGTVRMPDGREVEWKDGGKMSLHLDKLKEGDSIELRGPLGLIHYLGGGFFRLPGVPRRRVKRVGMLAGGTGITPMLQILQASVTNMHDATRFSLIYANKTEDDILAREYLDVVEKKGNGRIKIHYTLDHPPKNWAFSQGFITADMIQKHLPAPDTENETLILMCGPPPMVEFACKQNLIKLGYPKSQWVAF